MREFTTAVAEIEAEDHDDRWIEFSVDGILCRARRQPQDGQVAVLMATTGRHSSQQERIAGLINFFVGVLDEDSHSYIVNRLLDGGDQFGLANVEEILEGLMEDWAGRPTKQSSGSTTSPKDTGRSSTRRTTKST